MARKRTVLFFKLFGLLLRTGVLGLLIKVEIQSRLYWNLCGSRREWKQVNRFPCLFPIGWRWFLTENEGRSASRDLAEGWLRWSIHLLGWCCVQGCLGNTVLLLPAPQKWQLGFIPCSLSFIICPHMQTCAVIFRPFCSFFAFRCWRKRLFRCKHCNKGSQVPACLSSKRKTP